MKGIVHLQWILRFGKENLFYNSIISGVSRGGKNAQPEPVIDPIKGVKNGNLSIRLRRCSPGMSFSAG